MAIPRADLGVVDPVAAGVTKPTLVPLPRFMRLPRLVRLAPAAVVLAAAASSLFLFSHAPGVRAQCGGSASGATPCPAHAFLSLDVTAGDLNTVINVTGGQFLPNEQLQLYWDTPNKVAGGTTADGGGSFNTRVKPYAGDGPGLHKLCTSDPPNPCASFTINAPATSPSPSPSPSPTESPSASPVTTPGATDSATPMAATLNGFDVISRPPFVFLPIAGAVAIGLAVAFWLFSVLRRPRQAALPSAAVVHRATRPDYSASFGAAPPVPARQPEASAWDAPASPQAQPTPSPAPEPAPPASEVESVEWGPPVEWGTGTSEWGFPEPPEVDDLPDPPQPGD